MLFLICSYIVFSAVQDSHVKSTFKIGKLYYEFNETSNGLGNVISLVDVSPLSDEDGSRTRTYKVKVYNSSSKKEKVKIFIFDDKEMVSLDNCHNKLVGREFIKYSINGNESIFLGDEEKSIIGFRLALDSPVSKCGGRAFAETVRNSDFTNRPAAYTDFSYPDFTLEI